jgi:hypothetical protein
MASGQSGGAFVMKRCFHNAVVRELHPVRSATVA